MASVKLFRHGVGLICPGRLAKGDGEPVPAVDRNDSHRQLDQLFFTELGADSLEFFVRRVTLRDERDGFRPSQGRAFAVGVERRFAPGVEGVEPLFALAECPRASFVCMSMQ
jgi:hypothetical protein